MFIFSNTLLNNVIQNVFNLDSRRNRHQTHYEVLNLCRNCSAKDIKDAFVKYSKRYHPDRNTRPGSQAKFVKIVEAYSVLNNPRSRSTYDLGLTNPRPNPVHQPYQYYQGPWNDQTYWHNRNKARERYYERKPYYGIKGINKVSNGLILTFCLIIATFGVGLQILAARLRREEMKRKSLENELILENLQAEANRNGNELQIEKLKQRIKNNPDSTNHNKKIT